jgi:hypothetical protein
MEESMNIIKLNNRVFRNTHQIQYRHLVQNTIYFNVEIYRLM